ncbi:PRC-barrel domain-containing protein [Sulfitobacter sp. 1A15299]|uniref:PRC-barrel domain-containing protein n=1 Tax=Sulfitobacter sp. 1A15299 TaxID=3368598 RepID=UPI003745DFBB
MKRFLSTTAIVLTMSGAAFAEAHSEGFGNVAVEQTDFLASDLIGMRIYNSEAEVDAATPVANGAEQDWDDIGEINNIIVSQDGEVTAVILGVGGFLGLGERDVSISMDKIQILNDEDGDRFLVVNTSKEMLEQAPEFERPVMDGEPMEGDAMKETDANVTVVNGETEAEEMANEAEAETKEMANEVEAETEEMAQDAENAAENLEAETEEMANEVEAESEEMAQEAETMMENAEAETEEAVNEAEANTTVITGDETVERELLPRPEVEREGYAAAEAEMIQQMSADDLEGSYVYGANDETVGEIDTLLIGDDGKVDRVVINVGGFLGLGEKPVAVTFDELQVLKNVEGDDVRIYIDSTEERLESQPEYQGD